MSPPESTPALREFAAEIRSHPEVRAAFANYGPVRAWWRVILALHGAPGTGATSAERRTRVVARGFVVYAWIFRGLAGVLALALAVLALLPGVADSGALVPALAGGAPGCAALWIAAGLLHAGARVVRAGGDAAPYLALGLVLVMLILGLGLVAASVVVHALAALPVWLNLGGLIVMVTLGVGSYALELTYVLVTRGSASASTGD